MDEKMNSFFKKNNSSSNYLHLWQYFCIFVLIFIIYVVLKIENMLTEILLYKKANINGYATFDLKTTKITHQDVGQMDMYIRMYDELKRTEGDNPTLGIVLCGDTDEDIARYSILHGNEQLFASKYKTYMPSEEELRAEIETQKRLFYLQQSTKGGNDA